MRAVIEKLGAIVRHNSPKEQAPEFFINDMKALKEESNIVFYKSRKREWTKVGKFS